MNLELIKNYKTSYPIVYPFDPLNPPQTNLWLFDSWTYLPEDGSTAHPRRVPEKDLIVNVEADMLYISKQAGPETVDKH